MKKSNRDLLVLLKQSTLTPKLIEREMNHLHDLLYNAESLNNFVSAHELIDLNRYKIYKSDFEIKKFVRTKSNKPFLFLSNLN